MNKILMLMLFSFFSQALEIDEKLTLRLLDVSKSRKTVLINRGLEDGLVVGDHAKFFITTGIIARGVVIKASPARSIWSIYRIVKPDSLMKSKVVNIKISTAVKLTKDSSKSIRALVVGQAFGEPVDVLTSRSSSDEIALISNFGGDEASELGSLMNDGDISVSSSLSSASSKLSLEGWGLLSMSSLSGVYSTDGTDTDASRSSFSMSGGLEKYFPTSTGFFKKISLKFIYATQNDTFGSDGTSTVSQTDFGGGAAYWFGKGPFRNHSMMYFVDGMFGLSTITLSSSNSEDVLEGAGSFMSFGAGFKYMFKGTYGALGRFDYYSSSTAFDIEDTSGNIITNTYNVAGPRVLFGVFYRFM